MGFESCGNTVPACLAGRVLFPYEDHKIRPMDRTPGIQALGKTFDTTFAQKEIHLVWLKKIKVCVVSNRHENHSGMSHYKIIARDKRRRFARKRLR